MHEHRALSSQRQRIAMSVLFFYLSIIYFEREREVRVLAETPRHKVVIRPFNLLITFHIESDGLNKSIHFEIPNPLKTK